MPLLGRRGPSPTFIQMLRDTLNEGRELSKKDPERAKVMLRKIHRLISDADESERLAIENNKEEVIKILLEAGSLLFELSDKEKSIDFFEKVKEYNPKLPEPYYQIAKILASQNIQLSYALVNLQKAIELNPKFEDAMILMGDIYRMQGKIDETIKWYREAFNISKNRIDILDKILAIDPNNRDSLYSKLSYYKEKGDKESLANIYLQLALLENKIELIDEGLKISPDNFQLLKEKARFLINQGKFNEAEKFLEKVEKLKPDDPELTIIKEMMVQKPSTSESIFEDIIVEQAVPKVEEIIESANNPESLRSMITAYVSFNEFRENLKKAMEMLDVENAIILEELIKNGYNPEEFPFRDDLKAIIKPIEQFVKNNYDEAERLLNEYVSKNQRNAYAWYYKYKIAKIKGNENAAKNFRLMAMKLNPKLEKIEM